MMKPATMERRIRSIDAAIRALHGALMELQISVLEQTARLDAFASDPGLEGSRLPSPPPACPCGTEDDAEEANT